MHDLCELEYSSRPELVDEDFFLGSTFGFMSPRNQGRKIILSENDGGAPQLANNFCSS